MAWTTEDSPTPNVVSPVGTEQCGPCIKFFNPIFITDTSGEVVVQIDSTTHLNHYIVQRTVDVTFILNPVVEDAVDVLGLVVLITRDTDADVLVDDSLIEGSILRGLKQIDAKGDTIGLLSVKSTQFVIAGATRLVA